MVKKILITGAGGFIGSHLAEKCVELGWDVTAFVHYNSRNHWGWLEESRNSKDMNIVSGDIRDYDSVSSAIKGHDTVFHLAALIGIPYSYESPRAYIDTNICGTYNVLQSSKIMDLDNVIITSTSETYGTAQYVPIDEKHPVVGQSPYSATKIGADQLALSFYRSFETSVKIARPFNTYGPRQSARAVIPTIITQLLSSEKKIKIGNPTPTRDLTYVQDTVEGFLEIARSQDRMGEVTNIGMNTEISIGDLANLIAELMGIDAEFVTESERIRPDESEVMRLVCDNSKLVDSTGWTPKFTIIEGLEQTIEWFREHGSGYKSDIYNI
ncbi:SDR family NAD(P)-dependent oxidoreductase [Acidobacteriota bacterium]